MNTVERKVIFGAWDKNTEGSRALILSETWAQSRSGRKSPAYPQSREHIRLVEEEAYQLFIFPIIFSDELQDDEGVGPAKIKGFEPVLTEKFLARVGGSWYACDTELPNAIAEEVSNAERFVEGAVKSIVVNAYERNGKARSACIKHYGPTCAVCSFNFEATYGSIGKDFIHVHHIVPLSGIRKEYVLDPIRDLIPVCPNCHAVLHLSQPSMKIEDLRKCVTAKLTAREIRQ